MSRFVNPGPPVFHVDGLVFRADFDSGRLGGVKRSPDGAYNLHVPADCAEMGLTTFRCWYFFAVEAPASMVGRTIRIRMCNLNVIAKMYLRDCRPLVRVPSHSTAWERLQEPAAFRIGPARTESAAAPDTVEIMWNYTFIPTLAGSSEDRAATVYFALYYPFSYSDNQRLLAGLDVQQRFTHPDSSATTAAAAAPAPTARPQLTADSIYYHRETLCNSPDGREVCLLTISSYAGLAPEREPLIENCFLGSSSRGRPYRFKGKPAIVISSRVHPGETASSYAVWGLIYFLLQPNDPYAKALRAAFVWKIVPMVNVDGVARGHFRLDQYGENLNRLYEAPSLSRQPAIYAIRAVMAQIAELCAPVSVPSADRLLRTLSSSRSGLFAYFDFHGMTGKDGCHLLGNLMSPIREARCVTLGKIMELYCPQMNSFAHLYGSSKAKAKAFTSGSNAGGGEGRERSGGGSASGGASSAAASATRNQVMDMLRKKLGLADEDDETAASTGTALAKSSATSRAVASIPRRTGGKAPASLRYCKSKTRVATAADLIDAASRMTGVDLSALCSEFPAEWGLPLAAATDSCPGRPVPVFRMPDAAAAAAVAAATASAAASKPRVPPPPASEVLALLSPQLSLIAHRIEDQVGLPQRLAAASAAISGTDKHHHHGTGSRVSSLPGTAVPGARLLAGLGSSASTADSAATVHSAASNALDEAAAADGGSFIDAGDGEAVEVVSVGSSEDDDEEVREDIDLGAGVGAGAGTGSASASASASRSGSRAASRGAATHYHPHHHHHSHHRHHLHGMHHDTAVVNSTAAASAMLLFGFLQPLPPRLPPPAPPQTASSVTRPPVLALPPPTTSEESTAIADGAGEQADGNSSHGADAERADAETSATVGSGADSAAVAVEPAPAPPPVPYLPPLSATWATRPGYFPGSAYQSELVKTLAKKARKAAMIAAAAAASAAAGGGGTSSSSIAFIDEQLDGDDEEEQQEAQRQLLLPDVDATVVQPATVPTVPPPGVFPGLASATLPNGVRVFDPHARYVPPLAPGEVSGTADAALSEKENRRLARLWSAQKDKLEGERSKGGTGRVAAYREHGVLHSYTVECSCNLLSHSNMLFHGFMNHSHMVANTTPAAASSGGGGATDAGATGPGRRGSGGPGGNAGFRLHSRGSVGGVTTVGWALKHATGSRPGGAGFGRRDSSVSQQSAGSAGSAGSGGSGGTAHEPATPTAGAADPSGAHDERGESASPHAQRCLIIACPRASARPVSQIDVRRLAAEDARQREALAEAGDSSDAAEHIVPRDPLAPLSLEHSAFPRLPSELIEEPYMAAVDCLQPPPAAPRLPAALPLPAVGQQIAVQCPWGACPYDPPAVFASVGRSIAMSLLEVIGGTTAREAGGSSLVPFLSGVAPTPALTQWRRDGGEKEGGDKDKSSGGMGASTGSRFGPPVEIPGTLPNLPSRLAATRWRNVTGLHRFSRIAAGADVLDPDDLLQLQIALADGKNWTDLLTQEAVEKAALAAAQRANTSGGAGAMLRVPSFTAGTAGAGGAGALASPRKGAAAKAGAAAGVAVVGGKPATLPFNAAVTRALAAALLPWRIEKRPLHIVPGNAAHKLVSTVLLYQQPNVLDTVLFPQPAMRIESWKIAVMAYLSALRAQQEALQPSRPLEADGAGDDAEDGATGDGSTRPGTRAGGAGRRSRPPTRSVGGASSIRSRSTSTSSSSSSSSTGGGSVRTGRDGDVLRTTSRGSTHSRTHSRTSTSHRARRPASARLPAAARRDLAAVADVVAQQVDSMGPLDFSDPSADANVRMAEIDYIVVGAPVGTSGDGITAVAEAGTGGPGESSSSPTREIVPSLSVDEETVTVTGRSGEDGGDEGGSVRGEASESDGEGEGEDDDDDDEAMQRRAAEQAEDEAEAVAASAGGSGHALPGESDEDEDNDQGDDDEDNGQGDGDEDNGQGDDEAADRESPVLEEIEESSLDESYPGESDEIERAASRDNTFFAAVSPFSPLEAVDTTGRSSSANASSSTRSPSPEALEVMLASTLPLMVVEDQEAKRQQGVAAPSAVVTPPAPRLVTVDRGTSTWTPHLHPAAAFVTASRLGTRTHAGTSTATATATATSPALRQVQSRSVGTEPDISPASSKFASSPTPNKIRIVREINPAQRTEQSSSHAAPVLTAAAINAAATSPNGAFARLTTYAGRVGSSSSSVAAEGSPSSASGSPSHAAAWRKWHPELAASAGSPRAGTSGTGYDRSPSPQALPPTTSPGTAHAAALPTTGSSSIRKARLRVIDAKIAKIEAEIHGTPLHSQQYYGYGSAQAHRNNGSVQQQQHLYGQYGGAGTGGYNGGWTASESVLQEEVETSRGESYGSGGNGGSAAYHGPHGDPLELAEPERVLTQPETDVLDPVIASVLGDFSVLLEGEGEGLGQEQPPPPPPPLVPLAPNPSGPVILPAHLRRVAGGGGGGMGSPLASAARHTLVTIPALKMPHWSGHKGVANKSK